MGLLEGKNALVFGVANDHSIAWGIARALHAEGAQVGFSSIEALIEKRVRPLAESIGSTFVEPCDVQSDADIERVFARWGETGRSVDILVHALAFAKREDLSGAFVDTSRDGFALAMDVSAYSLLALARGARPYLRQGSSIITLTYYGSEKVVANYNVMGVAKAALEATVRYLAADLGPDGIRVNAISAGPIRTLAAAGIAGLQGDVRRLRRGRAVALEYLDRGRREDRRLPRVRPVERRHRRGRVRRRRVQHRRRSVGRGLTQATARALGSRPRMAASRSATGSLPITRARTSPSGPMKTQNGNAVRPYAWETLLVGSAMTGEDQPSRCSQASGG